jgi:flavorubredoxin
MMGFIEAATHRTKSRLREKLNLAGKKGGVFESYAWEEGDVLESLTDALKSWGVKVIPPMVAAMDRQLSMGIPINEESVKKCRELGKAVAEEVTRA